MWTLSELRNVLEVGMLIGALLMPVIYAVLEKRVDGRVRKRLDDLGLTGLMPRVGALEWFRDQNAVNISEIPRTITVLERVDCTLTKLDATLDEINMRVARIEGRGGE